jgi:RNA polymerase sigma-70 factor (ECF subfamily)
MDRKNRITENVENNDNDIEFVFQSQKGDAASFEVLVKRHQKKMLNNAYRITGNYDEACEVVQEAFFSAFRSIKTFRGDAKFSTWLTGITVNYAKNRLRQMQSRSYREPVSIDDPTETEPGHLYHDPPAREVSAIEQLERIEIQKTVQECIGSLDNDQREVLVLRDMEDLSYDEISLILKIPDGTVKSRLSRARNALKDCLKMKKVIGDL